MSKATSHNAQRFTITSPVIRHRAEVMADGSVALVSDMESLSIQVQLGGQDGPVTTIPLSSDQFKKLHALTVAPDKKLVYDHAKAKFKAVSMATAVVS